jgi:hypothetical protein
MSANFNDAEILCKRLEPVTRQQIGRLDATFKVPSSNDHIKNLDASLRPTPAKPTKRWRNA